jgi:hypothetical protein
VYEHQDLVAAAVAGWLLRFRPAAAMGSPGGNLSQRDSPVRNATNSACCRLDDLRRSECLVAAARCGGMCLGYMQ